jgi:hypothetical protein
MFGKTTGRVVWMLAFAVLLGGVGFGKRQPIRPYIQGKVTLSNNTEASIAFGIRFY